VLYEGDGDVDMDVDDAAPPEDEVARRRVKSTRKREMGSDDEDDEMVCAIFFRRISADWHSTYVGWKAEEKVMGGDSCTLTR
jgi:hypothetical protein